MLTNWGSQNIWSVKSVTKLLRYQKYLGTRAHVPLTWVNHPFHIDQVLDGY